MNFFRSLYTSLFNVEWLRARFLFPAQAWGYFFILALFLSIFSLVPVAVEVPGAIHEVRNALEAKVPNFSATVKDGELALTGVPNPYSATTEQDGKSLTLYVDTVATTTYDATELVQSPNGGVVLVTKDALEIYDAESGRDQVFPWKTMSDMTVTKEMLLERFDHFTSAAILPFIGFLVLLITYIGFVMGKLVSILIVSLVVLIACRVTGRGWRFGQLFTIALYACTLPSLIALVVWVIGLPIASIHFIALLAFMLAVVFTRDRAAREPVIENKTEVDKKLDLDLEP